MPWRSKWRRLERRQVLVNTHHGSAIRGFVMSATSEYVVLSPAWLEPGSRPVGGPATIPLGQVDFLYEPASVPAVKAETRGVA